MTDQTTVLTKAILEQGQSVKGAFNFAQMRALGIEPPPKKGWYKELIGKVVTTEAVERFLALKDAHTSSKDKLNSCPPPEIKEECGGCKFWRSWVGHEGYCHRYPQRLSKDAEEWCGEFKPVR